MSELDRTRLYNWMCDHADEQLAEYLMACLSPAPLANLVTKDHLTAELSRFATKDDLDAGLDSLRTEMMQQRDQDRAAMAAQRAEDRAAMATQRDEDRAAVATQFAEMAAQREEDRRAARHRHYWLVGIVLSALIALAAPTWTDALSFIT